ncbi:MAG: carbohydrate kinase [Phycisphaerae bacterium]|nr:carbohydrate kinase [Phycisphaerae bacterium]
MMGKVLAGIDVGTTGARCMLFDPQGNRIAGHYCEYGAEYPKPGWVEQDASLLIEKTMEACRATMAKSATRPTDIAAIGFSTQRSVTCPVDRDGRPVRPMISWQDARTSAEVEDMKSLIDPAEYYELSGLPMGTTWLITKLLWIRKHEPKKYAKTCKFIQNQDLILKAFGADDFHTDICDMVFYGVWDVKNVRWNSRLLDLFDVSADLFGSPTLPGTRVGKIPAAVAEKTGFAAGTPICTGAGDQNCGVVGMGAIKPGMGTVTLGTAGMDILCTDRPVPGFGGMMVTNHAVTGLWEVEGLSNAAASSYRWFRDTIGTADYEHLNELAAGAAPGCKGLLFLPYLATAATPHWNADARAAFIGLSLAHGKEELTRAVMEGVALEIRDMMQQWLQRNMDVKVLRIGGGATRSPLWNQIQADVYGIPVQTVEETESTVLGAAILAGVGAGIFNSIEEGVENMVRIAGDVEPSPENHALYEDIYQAFVRAYQGLDQGGAFASLARIQQRSS